MINWAFKRVDSPPTRGKKALALTHEEVSDGIKDFLARGGKIQKLRPAGDVPNHGQFGKLS